MDTIKTQILRFFVALIALFSLINIYQLQTILAEEVSSSESLTSDPTPVDEEEEVVNNSTTNIGQATATYNSSGYFNEIIPYAQFISYQYVGDGTLFDFQDIIMEYSPDANGIFQVAAYSSNGTMAHVYQIRENGLYELAAFSDYYTVEDLRYSAAASDGVESLILPSYLAVGTSYNSGYYQEVTRTIAEEIDTFIMNNATYFNVLRIAESRPNAAIPGTYNYYFAPDYGIILVEVVHSDGSIQHLVQLVGTQGYIQ